MTRQSGQPFDPSEDAVLQGMAEHWRQVWNDAPVQALARVEDAAKQLIGITAALQALYVAIFAFSNLRVQIAMTRWFLPAWLLSLLFFTPLCCWLISLYFATRVFLPRIRPDLNMNEVSVGAWQKVKDAYGRTVEEKLRWLQLSHRWLIASFVLVLFAIVLLVLLPTPPL